MWSGEGEGGGREGGCGGGGGSRGGGGGKGRGRLGREEHIVHTILICDHVHQNRQK